MADQTSTSSSTASVADTDPMDASYDSIDTSVTFHYDNQKAEHLQEMVSSLKSLRHGDRLCDVTIRIQEQTFRAHKLVLASASGFFHTMFTSGFKESVMEEVTLESTPALNADRFSLLLEFMYTGELPLSLMTLPDILAGAIYLQIKHAIQTCTNCLNQAFEQRLVTFDLVIKVLTMTSQCKIVCEGINDAAYQYLCTKFSELSQSEPFLKLVTFEFLSHILDQNSLVVAAEIEILDSVLSWLKFDWDVRKIYSIDLLARVRLLLLPLETITNVFEDMMQEVPECRQLYTDILKYYAYGKINFGSKILTDAQQEKIQTPRNWQSVKVLIAVGHSRKPAYMFSEDDKKLKRLESLTYIENTPRILRKSLQITNVNGTLYSCYGTIDRTYLTNSTLRVYRQETQQWVNLDAKMNAPRMSFGIASHGKYIYAFGGGQRIGDTTASVDNVERYDICRGKWEELPHLPYILRSHANMSTDIFQHWIIVTGYCKEEVEKDFVHRITPVMLYNTITSTWHTLSKENLCKVPHHDKQHTRAKALYVYVPKSGSTNTVYLITFKTAPSKYTRSRKWDYAPTVHEYHLDTNHTCPKFTYVGTVSQKYIPETKLLVFRIAHEVFIIVMGFIYKTSVTISADQTWDADLSKYTELRQITSEYTVTCYGLDKALL